MTSSSSAAASFTINLTHVVFSSMEIFTKEVNNISRDNIEEELAMYKEIARCLTLACKFMNLLTVCPTSEDTAHNMDPEAIIILCKEILDISTAYSTSPQPPRR